MNPPFGILLVSTALFWSLAQPVHAGNAAFFRVVASQATAIVNFDAATGSIAWTCTGETEMCRIEMAAPLSGSWSAILVDSGDGSSNGFRAASLPAAAVDVPFATLQPGDAFFPQTNAVVRSQEEWATLWAAAGRPAPATDVDFSREMVVVVAMGGQMSTGYDIRVQRVTLHWNRLVVRYGESYPAPGEIVFWVVTFPCHFVRLPRQDVPCIWLKNAD